MGTKNMQWMCDPCKKKFTPAATRIKIDMNGGYKRSRRKCMRVNINVTCFTHDNNFTYYIRFYGIFNTDKKLLKEFCLKGIGF